MSRYHAPSVSFPVGRSRFLGGCLLAWCVAVGVMWVCVRLGGQPAALLGGWHGALWGAGAVGLTAALCWRWWRTPQGWLTWEPVSADAGPALGHGGQAGSGWWWSAADGVAAQPLGIPVVVTAMGSHLGLRVDVVRMPNPNSPACPPFASPAVWQRWRPQRAAVRWLWADRAMQPDRWLALRRALTASHRA